MIVYADAVNFTYHATYYYGLDSPQRYSDPNKDAAFGVDLHGTVVYDPDGNRSAIKVDYIRGTRSESPREAADDLGSILYGLGLGINEVQTSNLTLMMLYALILVPTCLWKTKAVPTRAAPALGPHRCRANLFCACLG